MTSVTFPRALRIAVAASVTTAAVASLPAQELALPRKSGSVRFLVLGDAGTGDREQFDVANQMVRYGRVFPFTFAIMLGDNIYGSERPQDFDKKFIRPYKVLLDADVEFHAALGNHDDPNQRYYKPFHLDGNRYRTFKKGNVRFFVIDSNYLDPEQVKWLEKELSESGSDWKIAYFHHPLYTTARRGPEVELRAVLEPLVREARRGRRVHGTRAHLRAAPAAEGDLLLHGRRRGEAAEGRHSAGITHCGPLRSRPVVPAGRSRWRLALLPDD
jgi:hypothetical protein